jgi:hypothetical protein
MGLDRMKAKKRKNILGQAPISVESAEAEKPHLSRIVILPALAKLHQPAAFQMLCLMLLPHTNSFRDFWDTGPAALKQLLDKLYVGFCRSVLRVLRRGSTKDGDVGNSL